MGRYKIEIARSAEKVLYRLPKEMIPKILKVIEALSWDPYPSGCRKLTGQTGVFRVRVGVYRVLYEVYEDLILIKVLKIGHRKDIYR